MAYTPTEWESADVVTAVRMNALENAVGDIDMSYTPNVWSDGDILTADKMNALEQAVASGGGGGSSDFSTAEVTVVNNSDSNITLHPMLLYIDDHELTECVSAFRIDNEIGIDIYCDNGISVNNGDTGQFTFYFLTSKNFSIDANSITEPNTYVLDGSAETSYASYDGENLPIILVTGDCTITIS